MSFPWRTFHLGARLREYQLLHATRAEPTTPSSLTMLDDVHIERDNERAGKSGAAIDFTSLERPLLGEPAQ